MHKYDLEPMIISGRIGIVDASLVLFLEKIKEDSRQLMVHVTESIYNTIIPRSHICEFLISLSIVDGIVEDKTFLDRIPQKANTTLKTFPEKELQQYSIERIFKKSNIEDSQMIGECNKLTNMEELLKRYGHNPHKRKIKVGLVSGSFDLIHLGHIRYLKAAKKLADVVFVATMSTNSIKKQEKNIKGDRPIYSQTDRITLLSALRPVDYIVVFDESDCKEVIRTLKPNCFIKHQRDMSRPIVKEECDLVEMSGGKVLVTNDDYQYSSTDIINHIRNINAGDN